MATFYEEELKREEAARKRKIFRVVKIVSFSILALFGLIVLISSWYTVPEGSVAIVTRNGKVIGEAMPGLNFKLPIFDSAYEMSVKTQRVDFDGVASYSKDIQQSTSFISVNYRLLPSAVRTIYSTVGLNYAGTLLNARVYKHLKETFGKFNAVDIINQRDKISDMVEQVLRDDMEQFGVSVEDVQIANIDFSDAYEHAAEQAATAQAKVVEARQQLEKAKVDAQVQVANAEAKALATKATADAEAYATRVAGEAEAAAIKAKSDALLSNGSLVSLKAVERWNGVLPTTMVPGSTLPFLSLLSKQ